MSQTGIESGVMPGFILSTEADSDLREIYKYSFTRYGEQQADRYIGSLEESFRLLAETPLLCRERREFVPSVRIHHHGRHVVIYTEKAQGTILIVRVLHDSMDVESHLSDTPLNKG